MKRTTLILEESSMEEIRSIAAREGRPMSAVVNELLSEGLVRRMQPLPRYFRLPAYEMGPPGVDLADRDALDAVMEGR